MRAVVPLLLAATLVAVPLPLVAPTTLASNTCEGTFDALQNDAGSGGDAGESPDEATLIARDERHEGFLSPVGVRGVYADDADVYLFFHEKGSIQVRLASAVGTPLQVVLIDPQGQMHDVPAHAGASVSLATPVQHERQIEAQPGVWLLAVASHSTGVGAPVPCPTLDGSSGGGPASNYFFEVSGCDPWCLPG